MSLNLYLQAGTVPSGTSLPGNAQALANFIAMWTAITGGQSFNGVNFGPSTPTPENRDKPWFKTDASGNPVGLYSWNGIAWTTIPTNIANGPTAQRPSNPSIGTEFLDTTIGCLLIYVSKGWTTASGSVGDVKEVKAADLATALTNNPGWTQDADSVGLVVGGAGDATAITVAHPYGSVVGEEAHTLTIAELAAHTHTLIGNNNWAAYSGQHQNGTQPPGVYPIVTGQTTASTTASSGTSSPHNTMQPTIFYHRLVKAF